MGIINSNLPAVADSTYQNAQKSRLGVYCAACEPGYKAEKSFVWVDLNHVYDCNFISNCEEKGKSFNQCDKCEDGFTFKFYEGKVLKDECVEFRKDLNCYVTEEVSGVKECRYCKEGFSFNYDGLCEEIKSDMCEGGMEMLDLESRPLVSEFEFALLRFRNGWGCESCPENEIKFNLFEEYKSWFCTFSEYIMEEKFPADTEYDPLCRYYQASQEEILCNVCQPHAVLLKDKTCIERTLDLNNCELAEDQDTCITCSAGYINRKGSCVFMDIEDCVQYEIDPRNGDLLCVQCDIGFGLNKNVCVKDIFNPCQEINVQGECIECRFGFHLLSLDNNEKQCVPVSSHQNCLEYDPLDFNNKVIKCKTCSSKEFIL